ncbi:prephenate dehydratase [Aquihabitans sp. G128]|uniref:prephenate dehydratase n=1 Tax=Aquihabitans sp. G128 TaxID=2849779 RepID=UPI001C22BECC|nr:prephenate dehydratase [Aquihabitans sp. G128]QXC59686.1 prephenate dehydratase [Aquihabitans sp. G128]
MTDLAPPTPPPTDARPMRVGFLGPHGTFTEQALLTQPDLAAAELVVFPTMADVLRATETGAVDLGFVAIENSIEGTVNVTSDTLAFDVDVLIQREVVIPIQQHLMGVAGATLADITTVSSIPHATAQARRFLFENLPAVTTQAANSTAEAAEQVALLGDPSVAAIGNELAAKLYGLDIVARDIEDHPENQTRFVAVRPHEVPAPTGHDKTSIVVGQHQDRPGSLVAILQEFAARKINLTKLESRPTKKGLGDYCFLLDLEGHVADEVVADCLKALRTKHGDVKFLGSYPSAIADGAALRLDADEAARAADTWLAGIRGRIVGLQG